MAFHRRGRTQGCMKESRTSLMSGRICSIVTCPDLIVWVAQGSGSHRISPLEAWAELLSGILINRVLQIRFAIIKTLLLLLCEVASICLHLLNCCSSNRIITMF